MTSKWPHFEVKCNFSFEINVVQWISCWSKEKVTSNFIQQSIEFGLFFKGCRCSGCCQEGVYLSSIGGQEKKNSREHGEEIRPASFLCGHRRNACPIPGNNMSLLETHIHFRESLWIVDSWTSITYSMKLKPNDINIPSFNILLI